MSPLHVEQSSLLVPLAASIESCEALMVGQVVTVESVIEWKGEVARLGAALHIYDPSGRCVLRSAVKDLGEIAGGAMQLHFYFLADMPPGAYAISFEYWRGGESPAEVIDGTPGKGHSWGLMSVNNLFLEMTLGARDDNGHQEEFSGFRKFPVEVAISKLAQASPEQGQENMANPQFPWPLITEKFTREEIEEAIQRSIDPDVSPSESIALMTSRCGPRMFNSDCDRLGTQVGERRSGRILSTGKAGALVFGPYLPISSGRYTVVFYGQIIGDEVDGVRVDVVAKRGKLVLGKAAVETTTLDGEFKQSIDIVIPENGLIDVEFRIWTRAQLAVAFDRVEIHSNNFSGRMIQGGGLQNMSFLSGVDRSKKILLFFPNPVFIIHAVIVSLYIYKRTGIKIIIASNEVISGFDSYFGEICGIEKFVSLGNLRAELESHDIGLFVSHSGNSFDEANGIFFILNELGMEYEFSVYCDGFRNNYGVPSRFNRQISCFIFFGALHHNAKRLRLPSEIIDFFTINVAVSRCAGFANTPRVLVSNQKAASVFCLRYWGLGGYLFPSEIVAEVWFETVHSQIFRDGLLVIKGGGGHQINDTALELFKEKLRDAGISYVAASEYVESFGLSSSAANLPLEYLFLSGVFDSVIQVFSLDSSLPFIVASLSHLRRPLEVIIGAKGLSKLCEYPGYAVALDNVKQQIYSLESSVDIAPFSIEEIEEGSLFKVNLI